MNDMRKMGGLISAIEDAGIRVKSAVWEADDQLKIDVDEADEQRAIEVAQEFWLKKQVAHLEHIGLILVPNDEGHL